MKKTAVLSRIARSTLLILNIGAVVWLLLCKWASLSDVAGRPSLLSLLSFSCFFAVIANLLLILAWLFTRKKIRILLSLIPLILCWTLIRPLFGLNYFGNKPVSVTNDLGLKIMTWNVHMFDLGEWTKDKAAKVKILKLIKEENPDILCLQEFYWEDQDRSQPYTEILQQLGYPFVAFSEENKMHKGFITSAAGKNELINIGHAIFSKYPLRNQQRYPLFRQTYNMLGVEVVIDSSNIFNLNVVHLTSVGFGRKEMEYISEVKNNGIDAQDESQSKSLLRKLRDAAANRALLANRIDSLKRRMDYPQIICGDFNDVPGSYAYTKVKGKLSDAFTAKGAGLGRTYRHIFPTLRIDYIFYDPAMLKIEGYERPDVDLSDHYPVIASFSLRKTKKV
ncbi:endonuclease/exonuclease/phosphatase family protein [Taibaiella koreensis]|uniref:endonuclease/exonuclease/phosphatase family protein n=1 Tax=Taibaiella koreensis TaxID=1268548 RepID=UPI000E599D02|nr:endonuclease/exonuclease/phosphatase family protein [Taibaiella koreensis]